MREIKCQRSQGHPVSPTTAIDTHIISVKQYSINACPQTQKLSDAKKPTPSPIQRVSDHLQATPFFIAKQMLNNLLVKKSNSQNISSFKFPNKIATTHQVRKINIGNPMTSCDFAPSLSFDTSMSCTVRSQGRPIPSHQHTQATTK